MLSAPRADSAGFEHWVSPLVYLWNQCRVLPRYLALVAWPHPLLFDYGSPEPLGLGDVWPGALLLVALFALALFALWRWPAAGFVGIACFAVLSASSSVVPVVSEVGAERRMYLPLMALIALGVCAGELALARFRARALGPWLAGAAALALAAISFARAGDYRTEIALWQSDLRVAPNSRRAHYNLGKAFEREGRTAEAQVERAATVRGRARRSTRRCSRCSPIRCARAWTWARCTRWRARPRRPRCLYRRGARALARRRVRALAHGARAARARAATRRPTLAVRSASPSAPSTMTQRRDAAALEALARVQLARGRARAASYGLCATRSRPIPRQQRPRVLARVRDQRSHVAATECCAA